MITPFICEDLFEFNDSITYEYDEVNEVIIIDNLYKNYDKILDIVYNMPVEQWKASENTGNFIDYYDCRPLFHNEWGDKNILAKKFRTLGSIINNCFKTDHGRLTFDQGYIFNYFKHIKKDVPNYMQNHPHYDFQYNVITYLDTTSNGGTAIYENVDNWQNNEHEYSLYDTRQLKMKCLIPSKPNRCVIFSGRKLHGAYITENNVYYYNWRINMVNFIGRQTNT